MGGLIAITVVLLSLLWSAYWCLHFMKTNAEGNAKNMSIMFAPFIAMFICIMLFVLFWC